MTRDKAGGSKAGNRAPGAGRMRQRAWIWLILLFLLSALVAVIAVSCGREARTVSAVPASVIHRTPLDPGQIRELGYMTDRIGWLEENKSRVEDSLRYFYDKTGVQPYIYLRSALGAQGATQTQMNEYAETLYSSLFLDESHLLLLLDEQEGREPALLMGVAAGKKARLVMDQEALDILTAYWSISPGDGADLTQAQKAAAAGEVLRQTADNIMMVRHTEGWIWLLGILIGGLLLLAGLDFRKNWLKIRQEANHKA